MVNGQKIRELREGSGLSISQFAQAVSSSQAKISYVETGIQEPSVRLLARIADYFGLKVDDLLLSESAKEESA